MSKDKLIVSQVAFKGAIDLAVAGKIEVDMITSATDAYAKHIWDNFGVHEYKQVSYPPKGKSDYGGEPSTKQINFLNKLIKEVPKSVADSAQAQLDDGLTGVGASTLIKTLLDEKESSAPQAKQSTDDNVAPF